MRFFRIYLICAAIFICLSDCSFAQINAGNSGAVKGIVKDENGNALQGATLIILETSLGCTTGPDGAYILKNLKTGTYTLTVSYLGYVPAEIEIIIEKGVTAAADFFLEPTAFQIGGIEVYGQKELLPADVTTKTIITSGEIEHYQASSVKDVLDLVPGVQKTNNPGIGKTGQVVIRGTEIDNLSALGTLIVVDGIPVSNNANLQFHKLTGSKFGVTDMGGGTDLRTIPADNIESIEVIRGLPSVRYGDVTEGVISINTKSGKHDNRLKIKQNPDTREANLGGGFSLGNQTLSYNLNYALSERDIRLEGDEYSRLTGQLNFSQYLLGNKLEMNHKLSLQKIFDYEEPKNDIWETRNFNKGFTAGYSNWGKLLKEDGSSGFEYNTYFSLKDVNTTRSKVTPTEPRIVNGDTISSYRAQLETRGKEWNIGGRFEWNSSFITGSIAHKLMLGTEIQYNANTGEGVVIDSVYNYFGLDSGRRSYSFDDIPGQILAGIYAQDNISWHFVFDFSLMIGFRYEMYRPYQFNLKGLWGDGPLVKSHQGSFFNPRLNLMVHLSKVNQLRLNAGTTSKSPAMSSLYYYPVAALWRNPDDLKIYKFSYNTNNTELKGIRESQIEISYDHKLSGLVGTSFSFYYKDRRDESQLQTVPFFIQTTKNKVHYVTSFSVPMNLGWTISKGAEFTIRTNRIKPLNMTFMVTGAYSYINASQEGFSYDLAPDASKGRIPNFKVPGISIDTLIGFAYPPAGKWNDSFQLNYYIQYTLPPLGLWVTLRAEHRLYDRAREYNQEPQEYSLLSDADRIVYDFEREIKRRKGKWLLNLNISKSLFRGAEISFYVNNLLNDPAVIQVYISPGVLKESSRNPVLFYGIEFSCEVDKLFRGAQ